MARAKGILDLAANFEPQAAAPLDARHLVPDLGTLVSPIEWQASDGTQYVYVGMRVTVVNDPTPENNGVYWLKSMDYTQLSSWEKVGSDGSGGDEMFFVQPLAPANPQEGWMWYQTTTENLFTYREVSPGVLNWVPIVFGTGTSDVIDGGTY